MDHMLAGLIVCIALALAASSLAAYLSLRAINGETSLAQQRHSAFCNFLTAQQAAVAGHPALAPLEPGLRIAFASEGCVAP